jgi:hypothetical protein
LAEAIGYHKDNKIRYFFDEGAVSEAQCLYKQVYVDYKTFEKRKLRALKVKNLKPGSKKARPPKAPTVYEIHYFQELNHDKKV